MKRSILAVVIQCLTLCSQWHSANAQDWTGDRVFLNLSVHFVRESDGSPMSLVDAFIVETMNRRPVYSQRLKTDRRGAVSLYGYYCVPLSVGMEGGHIAIGREDRGGSYVVKVPSVSTEEDFFGAPEIVGEKSVNKAREACRF